MTPQPTPPIGTFGRCRLRHEPYSKLQHENLNGWDPKRRYAFGVVTSPCFLDSDPVYLVEHGETRDKSPWVLVATETGIYSSNPDHFRAYFEIVEIVDESQPPGTVNWDRGML